MHAVVLNVENEVLSPSIQEPVMPHGFALVQM
jgi:hypothetical protein